MSILLEALRKSEAQRRLGETPTLQTPETAENAPAGDQRYGIPVLLVVLAAALITWMGLAQFRAVPAEPQSSVLTSTLPSGHIQPEAATDSPISGRDETRGKSASTPVEDFSAPPLAVPAGPPSHSPEAGREKHVDLLTQSPVTTEPATKPEPGGSAMSTELLQAESDEDSVVAEQGDDRLEPYVTEPLSYWQMPQSLRDSMPPLHITVLVYAEKPGDRFVLINGERLREKEALGEGLVLEEIQRDRAIFSYRNYRFQVKG